MAKEKGKVKQVSEARLKKTLEKKGARENRSAPRLDARLAVEIPLANWEQVRKVYTTNISKGGMLFSLTSPTTMPAAVELTLSLPDGGKVTLQSEVRHVARREGSAEFDVGVQFIELDAATRKTFEQALAGLDKK